MTWNHRVVRHVSKSLATMEPIESFSIHEVYASDELDGMIGSITEDAVAPWGDDVEGLRWTLQRMLEACDKPVVDFDTATAYKME